MVKKSDQVNIIEVDRSTMRNQHGIILLTLQ